MRTLLYRYLFGTALAAFGYLCLFAFGFFANTLPYDYMSGPRALDDVTKVILGIALTGMAFTFNFTFGTPHTEPDKELERDVIDTIWFGLKGLGAYAQIAIGCAGILASLTETVDVFNFHAETGFWHAASFCENAQIQHLCSRAPVVSWLFKVPTAVIYAGLGAAMIYRGRSIIHSLAADNSSASRTIQ